MASGEAVPASTPPLSGDSGEMKYRFVPRGKFVATLFYLGTPYKGFQSQGDTERLPTVQDALQLAIDTCAYSPPAGAAGGGGAVAANVAPAVQTGDRELLRVVLQSSGRTDTGVHASGQVVHFYLRDPAASKIQKNLGEFRRRVNQALARNGDPVELRSLAYVGIGVPFHAHIDVVRKQYSFYIAQGHVQREWLHFAHYVPEILDVNAIREALGHFVGTHDFSNFCTLKPPRKSYTRTILKASVTVATKLNSSLPVALADSAEVPQRQVLALAEAGGKAYLSRLNRGRALDPPFVLRVKIVGNGFLRNMVRRIAAALIAVGKGARDPAWVRHSLGEMRRPTRSPDAKGASKNQPLRAGEESDAAKTQPNTKKPVKLIGFAHGLWLERVWYRGVPPSGVELHPITPFL